MEARDGAKLVAKVGADAKESGWAAAVSFAPSPEVRGREPANAILKSRRNATINAEKI